MAVLLYLYSVPMVLKTMDINIHSNLEELSKEK